MTTSYDLDEQSRQYKRESDRAYREARRDALHAERSYKAAREYERHARWLASSRLSSSDPDDTPAQWESFARTSRKLGDTLLRASFSSTERFRFYRQLSRDYAQMAADRRAWLAAS